MLPHEPMEVLMHTVAQAMTITGLGKTTIYAAIGAKQLDARKAGSRTLITAESLRNYVASFPAANIGAGKKSA